MKRPYLLIVGGEQRDGIDYAAAVRACNQNQKVVLTGRLEDTEVAPLFRRSDLFVFPTLADTLPLVVLEAMSHGLPVIASNVGGIPFQIAPPECGQLVPAGDALALATAINSLADDPASLRSMSQSARARVAAEFTWESSAQRALAGYERVLQRRGQHHRATSMTSNSVLNPSSDKGRDKIPAS